MHICLAGVHPEEGPGYATGTESIGAIYGCGSSEAVQIHDNNVYPRWQPKFLELYTKIQG